MSHTAFVILAVLTLLGVPLAGAALVAFNHGTAQAERQTYVLEPSGVRAVD